MVRLALGPRWKCEFANDIDQKKAAIYKLNFNPDGEFYDGDLADVPMRAVPDHVDLAWSSFPCQDLSLAGTGEGLGGRRSSAYWHFWRFVEDKNRRGCPFPLIAIENVVGLITSHHGRDFRTIVRLLCKEDYSVGAFILNAASFVPQSRPRVFILAIHNSILVPENLVRPGPYNDSFFPKRLIDAVFDLRSSVSNKWVWWYLPWPQSRRIELADVIQLHGSDTPWHTTQETEKLLSMMSPLHRSRIEDKLESSNPTVGTIYRRTRRDATGQKVQRAEVRFDGIGGALRTPAGGSSRQIIIVIMDGQVRTRLISTREAARLMGMPDAYRLPTNYNEAYHLLGDGVVVDVVRWISTHTMEPILAGIRTSSGVA